MGWQDSVESRLRRLGYTVDTVVVVVVVVPTTVTLHERNRDITCINWHHIGWWGKAVTLAFSGIGNEAIACERAVMQ